MKYLLKNLTNAIDGSSSIVDIVIDNGIVRIDQADSSVDKVINMEGKIICHGFFDLNADFCDPGNEIDENLDSGAACAASGGFTKVLLSPASNPDRSNRIGIEYVSKNSPLVCDLYCAASLSVGLKGKEFTDILDLYDAGALSFSDGDKPIWNSKLLLKALEYTKHLSIPIMQNARDQTICSTPLLHEGNVSTVLGLSGEPGLSEVLVMKRDLEILRYSGGRIHFSRLSTAEGVNLVRAAKAEGLDVTCDVAILNLLFVDESLTRYDTNFKVLPVLRAESDRLALVEGISDGTIDAICSNHRPVNIDDKKVEFDQASYGAITLQFFLPLLMKLQNEIPQQRLLEAVTLGPLHVLGIEPDSIESLQSFTIFDSTEKWIFDRSNNLSRSHNSSFLGQEMTGKVKATFCNGILNFVE